MDILKIIGIAISGVCASLILKQYRQDLAMAVSICAGMVIFYFTMNKLLPVIGSVSMLMQRADIPGESLKLMAKSLGVCIAAQIGADICRDSGETALAGKVELAGKTILLFIAVPLILELLEVAGELIWM